MAALKEHISTFLRLNVMALGVIHVANRFIFSVSGGKNMLKPGGGKYYRWKYGEVFYHKYGEGSPLVLLHDTRPSFSSYEWNEVVDELSRTHTVYAVDLPGCGRSAKPHISYTNYFYVLFLSSFIKEVVHKKCEVMASGYSSSFAVMTAFMNESLIGKITAVNPQNLHELSATSDSKCKAAARLLRLPVIGTTVYNIAYSRENIDYSFTEKFMFNPFHSKRRFVDAFYEGAHFNEGNGKYLLASLVGKYMEVDISKALRKMSAKMTILYGDRLARGRAIAGQYQKVNPSVKALELSGTKVLPHMERPQEFISVYSASSKLH